MGTVTDRRVVWAPSGFLQGGPRTLAALRVSAGAAALVQLWEIRGFVIPPESLRFPPPGTAWLSFLPVSQILHGVALAVGLAASAAVLVGWRPRWTAAVAAGAIFYAGWLTTLTGKVDHMHHLIWVMVILAVSPCANVWAVRREQRVGSYQWPVTAVIVLIGLIYFGAGLQKLMSAGLAWGWSDNLLHTMLQSASRSGREPVSWLVDFPLLGRIMGVGALLFELSFLALVLHPKTRRFWPVGLFFHWGTWAILGIPFYTLQLLYVVFLPFDRDGVDAEPTGGQRRVVVGLVAVVAVFAVSGVDLAWPVAAYPGFEGIRPSVTTEYTVDEVPIRDNPVAQSVGWFRATYVIRGAWATGRTSDLEAWLGGPVDAVQVDLYDKAAPKIE